MRSLSAVLFLTLLSPALFASEVKVGDPAPLFELKTHEGQNFSLQDRKGHWTVLYFYPKAETPGCTKQACAFRDNIQKIRAMDAEVYGISVNSVADQAKFHANHQMNFTLLADDEAKVTDLYGSKMPILKMSKRWTFVIDPELKIRSLEKNVDPVKDAEQVAATLGQLGAGNKAGKK